MKKRMIYAALVGLFILGNSGELFARGGGGGRSGGFGGGSRSFSSPSRSFSSPSRSSSSPPTTSSSGGWFSRGSSATQKATTPTPSTPSSRSSWWNRGNATSAPASPAAGGPPKTTVNSGIAREMSNQRSQEKYMAQQQQTSAPRGSTSGYFRSNSSSAGQQRIRDLKRDLNYERMQNRDLRAQQFYGPRYYSAPAPMMYHDSFNPWFWMWLMDRNNNTRAETIYHHRDEMDPERYKELLAKDAALEAKIKELEAQGVKKDPSYVPPDLKDNKDLMYSDAAVKAAYDEEHSSSFPWFWTMVAVVAIGGIIFFFVPILPRGNK